MSLTGGLDQLREYNFTVYLSGVSFCVHFFVLLLSGVFFSFFFNCVLFLKTVAVF